MSTPQELVVLRDPQFIGESRLDDLVTLATELTGTVFGTSRNYAIALLVLHWLSGDLTSPNGQAGSVTSEKEGDLARSYGLSRVKTVRDADLAQTKYGLELLSLRKAKIFAARNRTM